MPEKLILNVAIDGIGQLVSVQSFQIHQKLFDHHSFELSLPVESLSKNSAEVFNEIPNIIGKDVLFEWETGSFKEISDEASKASFKGIITDVSISGQRKEHRVILLKGYGYSYLMDGVADSNCYANKGIYDIFEDVLSKQLGGHLEGENNLTFKDKLPFSVQFEETDFDYIRRLCFEHGEWLYYDGEKLCLGLSSDSNSITLNQHKVFDLNVEMRVIQPSPKAMSRNYVDDAVTSITPESPVFSDNVASSTSSLSNELFPSASTNKQILPSRPEVDDDHLKEKIIQKRANFQNNAFGNRVLTVSGYSDHSEMQIGSTLTLENLGYDGDFVVIEVDHIASGRNNYRNYFVAIPGDAVVPPDVSLKFPEAKPTVAKVTNNDDPSKLGRIKVTFDWCDGVESPWLRMVQTHAGEGRGFYFIPEIDDEVVVDFELSHPDFPFVVGSIYNGKQKFDTYYNAKDEDKAIRTKSGHELVFQDGEKKLIIRNEKNSITLDFNSNGTISIVSEGDIAITADKNISLDAQKNISLKAGGDISLDAMNISETAKSNVTIKGNSAVNVSGTNSKFEGKATVTVTGAIGKIEAKGVLDVKATGITSIGGAMVKLN